MRSELKYLLGAIDLTVNQVSTTSVSGANMSFDLLKPVTTVLFRFQPRTETEPGIWKLF